jgi:hypothetical protein
MTDLVRCGSMAHATRSASSRLLHRYMWAARGPDTFAVLDSFVRRLRAAGYRFLATHELYRKIQAESPAVPNG